MRAERHDLIYLHHQAEFSIISIHPDKKVMEQQVIVWLEKELPCIYARQPTSAVAFETKSIQLGLSLVHDKKKHRVSLRVMPSAVQKQQLLPQLMAMQNFFSHYYGIELSTIAILEKISDIAVYGSFLFHYLSGQPFVDSASDLDLLFNYQNYSLLHLAELIEVFTETFKRTIDGEVRFPLLGDVPINELLDRSEKKLLCKRRDKVILLARSELYEHYPLL